MFCLKKGAAIFLSAVLSIISCSSAFAAEAADIDKEEFDKLISGGKIAEEQVISENKWARAIRDAGVLRVGGTQTSYLFSQLDETDGDVRGFDAGLFKLLTRYILGDESAYELTLVDSNTRESVLVDNEVDAVIATYSITDSRKKVVSFAGPYYTSRQAILVQNRNTSINGLDDLEGKIVATQSSSTGPDILAEYCSSDMEIQEFETDRQARTALKLGLVDAYVTDYTLMLNAIVKAPEDYRIAGDQFGPEDNYGIGLPLGSDGVEFVNDFLEDIIEDGTWTKLWQITLGDRTGMDMVPEVPVIAGEE